MVSPALSRVIRRSTLILASHHPALLISPPCPPHLSILLSSLIPLSRYRVLLRYVSKKIISGSSRETLRVMVSTCPTAGVLSLLLGWSSDSHHQTRHACMEGICSFLQEGRERSADTKAGATAYLGREGGEGSVGERAEHGKDNRED